MIMNFDPAITGGSCNGGDALKVLILLSMFGCCSRNIFSIIQTVCSSQVCLPKVYEFISKYKIVDDTCAAYLGMVFVHKFTLHDCIMSHVWFESPPLLIARL